MGAGDRGVWLYFICYVSLEDSLRCIGWSVVETAVVEIAVVEIAVVEIAVVEIAVVSRVGAWLSLFWYDSLYEAL